MLFLIFTTSILISGTFYVVRSAGSLERVEGAVSLISEDKTADVSTVVTAPIGEALDGAVPRRLQMRRHKIVAGENLWMIARQYNVDMQSIIGCNESLNKKGILQPEQELLIPNQKGILYRLQFGQTLSDLSSAFNVRLERIFEVNGIKNAGAIPAGEPIFLPGAEPLPPGNKRLKFLESLVIDTTFAVPLKGRLTGRFGWRVHPIRKKREFHRGIDIAALWGSKVKAAQDGEIAFAGWKSGYGYFVKIKHRFNYTTCYGHLTGPLTVKAGQKVRRGDVVGRIGATGTVTGAHLHFEVHRDGRPVNPQRYLQ